ncbi:MAG: HNH endonuclease signature motif containing protein [Patescibacteria group bacterium]
MKIVHRITRPSSQNVLCPNCKVSFYPGYEGKGKYQKYCSKSCSVKAQHKRKEIGFENKNPNYIDGRSSKILVCSCGKKTSSYRNKLCLKCFRKKMSEENWKGGRYFHQGYVYVYSPQHPNRVSGGYIKEHRLVMEKHLKRYLTNKEVVHHKNRNKSDNRIENLQLMTHSEHTIYHNKHKNK